MEFFFNLIFFLCFSTLWYFDAIHWQFNISNFPDSKWKMVVWNACTLMHVLLNLHLAMNNSLSFHWALRNSCCTFIHSKSILCNLFVTIWACCNHYVCGVKIAINTPSADTWNILDQLCEYRDCWCLCFLCCHGISSHAIDLTGLTHWGLVTPYGDKDLGQHWLR